MWMYTLHISLSVSECVFYFYPSLVLEGKHRVRLIFAVVALSVSLSITHALYLLLTTKTQTHWWLLAWRYGRTKRQNWGFPSLPFYPTCRISSISKSKDFFHSVHLLFLFFFPKWQTKRECSFFQKYYFCVQDFLYLLLCFVYNSLCQKRFIGK